MIYDMDIQIIIIIICLWLTSTDLVRYYLVLCIQSGDDLIV